MADVSKVELRHLRYFLAVAEELHFGRAARRLGVAQPPVSQQIAALERMVGVALFQRTTRQVRLTPAGRALEREARRALTIVGRLQEVASNAAAGKRTVSIGVAASASLGAVASSLRRLREDHPDLELIIREGSPEGHAAELRAGVLDLAVVRPPLEEPDLHSLELMREEVVLAVIDTHPFASRAEVEWSEIAECDIILFPRSASPAMHDSIIASSVSAGAILNVKHEATGWPQAAALVAAGMGVGFVPSSAQAFVMEGVALARIAEPRPASRLLVAWHDDTVAPLAEAFARAVKTMRA